MPMLRTSSSEMSQAGSTTDEVEVTLVALYTDRYVPKVRQPGPGSTWWTEAQAVRVYGPPPLGTLVVVEERYDDGGTLAPSWVLGFSPEGLRVQALDGHGTILQIIDYDIRGDRLWRWTTTMYTYPSTDRFFRQTAAVARVTSQFEPDGTGVVEFDDTSDSQVRVARMSDAPVDGFWADWPVFGEWEPLTDPNYGAPGSPEVPFSTLRA